MSTARCRRVCSTNAKATDAGNQPRIHNSCARIARFKGEFGATLGGPLGRGSIHFANWLRDAETRVHLHFVLVVHLDGPGDELLTIVPERLSDPDRDSISMSAGLEGLTEVDFLKMIYDVPGLIDAFEGKKLEREVEAGGQFIDFAFVDGTFHHLVEMKYRQDPKNAIEDLLRKAPKYAEKHRVALDRLVLMILVDEPTASGHTPELQLAEQRMGIRVLRYDPEHIAQRYEALTKRKLAVGQSFDLPDADRLSDLGNDVQRLVMLAPLLQIVRAVGFRGGYYQARREVATGHLGQLVVPLVSKNQTDDATWLCFLRAATNSDEAAVYIYKAGWSWRKVRTNLAGFKEYYAGEYERIRFGTSAGWEKKELPQTVESFVELVGDSPSKFFMQFLEREGNFWGSYEEAYNAVKEHIHKFGHWKAKNLFRHLEWYRVLPFQPEYVKPETGTYEGLRVLFGRDFSERDAQQKVRDLAEQLGLSPLDVDLALWVIAGQQETNGEAQDTEGAMASVSALPRVTQPELRAMPDGLLVLCSADPDKGLDFLVEHHAWGFPPVRRAPVYFALYVSGEVKSITAFAKVASVEDPKTAKDATARSLRNHSGYREGGRVILFESGSLRHLDPEIPLGPSRHAPQSFGYFTLASLARARTMDDL